MLITSIILNGALVIALIYKHLRKERNTATINTILLTEIDYLKARIRGFQQYATNKVYDDERKYNVQQANGKFTAAWLPNVE